MKKINKSLFLIVFIISSFLCLNLVKADYKAIVVNDANASCNLRSGSTGYCYYSNSSLNSFVPGVVWLDTGDEVTVITSKPTVATNNTNICKDYYVYTSFYFSSLSDTFYGYYCNANLTSTEITDAEREEFRALGFPESYISKLVVLKKAHPNWSFKAINTKLNFSDAVLNESYGDNSLLRGSMSNNYAYLSLNSNSFSYLDNRFIPYDDTTGSDPWYLANYDTIAYYMDPRNYLSDMYIFQFETLSYDSSIPDDSVKSSIGSIFGSDYLKNYIDTFLEAGKQSKVNPIYLASLSKEEVSNGEYPGAAINGNYNGMYNFYNIGAYSGSDPVYNGLLYASYTDDATLRPWNTPEKAVIGGAKWIYNNYVYTGQDTSYFKKFNVVQHYLTNPTFPNYSHQYMQNIAAPSSEATATYRSYYNNNMLGLSYTFFIPVYNNMPTATSLPTKTGWPNNYLKSLSINEKNVADFRGDVEVYNYSLDINNPNIKIDAKSISGSAKVEGLGTFEISENTTKTIKVTAQNGDVKNYKINITLTGTLIEDPVDVQTTLNNAGIKNGDKYISGLSLNTDIATIKTKILNANENATVVLKNSSGEAKASGSIATGDKVIVTVGSETKEFEIVIYGDISGDGNINNIDFIRLKKHLLNTITLSDSYKEASDISKDGNINNIDFIRLKKYLLGDSSIIVQ